MEVQFPAIGFALRIPLLLFHRLFITLPHFCIPHRLPCPSWITRALGASLLAARRQCERCTASTATSSRLSRSRQQVRVCCEAGSVMQDKASRTGQQQQHSLASCFFPCTLGTHQPTEDLFAVCSCVCGLLCSDPPCGAPQSDVSPPSASPPCVRGPGLSVGVCSMPDACSQVATREGGT